MASSSPADRPHYHSGIFFLVIEVFEPVTFNNALGFDLQPKKVLAQSEAYRIRSRIGRQKAATRVKKFGYLFSSLFEARRNARKNVA